MVIILVGPELGILEMGFFWYREAMESLKAQLSRPYPSEWSVRQALEAYLSENGFSTAEYDSSVVKVTFWSITFPLPNPPSRQIAVRLHDLHHVVTGYGTDPVGEAEISAWELRRGVKIFSLFVQTIVIGGVFLGLLHSPRKTLAAWRAGYHPHKVPLQAATMENYHRLLELSVGELRELYGVGQDGIAGARELHYAAPSRR